MGIGEWLVMIFVGLFLLAMAGAVVGWVTQLVRSHRRHHPKRGKR